jgi:molybdopterin-containing oxidoreductase family membrane subunit
MELFSGRYALLFWGTQLLGLIVPLVLLLFRKLRRPLPMLVIAIFVLIGAWVKRLLIVVPTMENPFLPIQNVPLNFKLYTPTLIETAVTLASVFLVLIIITILSKLVPIIPIDEIELDEHEAESV